MVHGAGCGQWVFPNISPSGGYANPELLMSPADAADALDGGAALILVDTRPRADFEAGHLPGAISLDMAALNGPGELLLPPEEVAQALGLAGLSEDLPVLVYGGGETGWGTDGRLFWILEYLGHDGALALLNGGFEGWAEAGLPVEVASAPPDPRSYIPAPNAALLATTEEVADAVRTGVQLLDTRSPAEYAAGHIPGALLYEWSRSLNVDGTLRSGADILDELTALGVDPHAPTITYCASGYRSAHFYFTGRLLGMDALSNYDGSWEAWTAAGGAIEGP